VPLQRYPTQQWRLVPRNVWVLASTSLFRDIASEMLVHLLPLYLANVLLVRTATIGLIEGIAETTASLTKIYSGWLSDRLGKRKWITVLGYSVSAAAVPLLAVARGAPGIGAARFFDRLGKGIRTAPRDALIADSITADRRGLGFGLHRAADSAGAFLGLLISLAIVWQLQRGQLTLDAATFRTVVAWATIPAILAAVIVAAGVREAGRSQPRQAPKLSIVGLDNRFRRFLVVMVLFTLGNSSDAFLILRAQSVGASVLLVLGMLALHNLVYTLAAGPAGAVSDTLDRRRVMLAGWLVYSAIYAGFAYATQTWQLWLLYAGYGLHYALTEGVAKAMVADMVPEDERGTAYGVFNASIGVMALPASVVAGLLWQGFGPWGGAGPSAPFLFGSALALASSMLLWRWVR
jgi:MFS family permease